MNAPRCVIDFESRSACDLKKSGTWRYSLHPTTEVLCLCFRLPHWEKDRVEWWHPAIPSMFLQEDASDLEAVERLHDYIRDGGLVEAHNVWFEFCVWRNILVARCGWPDIPTEQWRCSAAKAAAHALHRSLDKAALALRLRHKKDMEGHKLMQKMSKPRKSRKAERTAWDALGVEHPTVLWHDSPDMLARLIDYCKQDVLTEEAVSNRLADLSPQETALFLLDLRINERGFQIDRQAVRMALQLVHRETLMLNQELARLTDGQIRKSTQRERILAWLEANDLWIPNTQAATLDDTVNFLQANPDTAPPTTLRVLQIVRALGRSSTAKYVAMKRWWDTRDGRVRGGLLYHGASTGRWSGKGIQPHNFPKGAIKGERDETGDYLRDDEGKVSKLDMARLWTAIKGGQRDQLISRFGGVMEALSTALRGAIVAGHGRRLFVADYAAIEARVLLWVAGDEEHLDLFRRNEDIYIDMARAIRPDADRALGKVACLAADTVVLTDSGPKTLVRVLPTDKLWDGKEWVSHGGLVYNGLRETICLDGLHVTPDHLTLAGPQWTTADAAALDVNTRSRAYDSGLESLQSLVLSEGPDAGLRLLWSVVDAALPSDISSLTPISEAVALHDVDSVRKSRQCSLVRSVIGATRTFFRIRGTEHDCSTGSAPLLLDVKTPEIPTILTTEGEASMSGLNGWRATGLGNGGRTWGDERCWPIWSRYKAGMIRSWSWIVKTMTEGMNRIILGSYRDQSTSETSEKSECSNSESQSLRPVFDLVDAGPRHRFTVLTDQGALIVHNCLGLGYQMGADKFYATCQAWRVPITEELAEETVVAYRQKYWRVKQLWQDVQDAAIEAVETKQVVKVACCEFFCYGLFLYCRLPSGRLLAYAYPEIRQKKTPWGEIRSQLSYMGVDAKTHQWKRQTSYGGLLVENLVQAISRDVMAEAMLRCEANGYPVILSVHDEVIAEGVEGSAEEFGALLEMVPRWAAGCPIAVESWEGRRYRK